MIENFTCLSIIKSEVGSGGCAHEENCEIYHQERLVSMALGVKRIISIKVAVGLVVSIGLIHDQFGMRVGRKDVLMASDKRILDCLCFDRQLLLTET